jgi:PAS domain-containing protein
VSLDPTLTAHAGAAAGDALVTLEPSLKVAYWNRADEQRLGFSREEAMEQGLALIIPAEYRARHVLHSTPRWTAAISHGGAVARVEAMTASGGRLVLGLSLGLLGSQDGQPSRVAGVLRPLGDAAVEFVTPEEGNA